jgi:hypothetical protein
MSQEVCPHCRATGMVAGVLESTGTLRFRPLQTRFLTFRTADVAVRAMMCPTCGCVTMMGDSAKLRVLSGTQERTVAQGTGTIG